jgi:hypothetical protein
MSCPEPILFYLSLSSISMFSDVKESYRHQIHANTSFSPFFSMDIMFMCPIKLYVMHITAKCITYLTIYLTLGN